MDDIKKKAIIEDVLGIIEAALYTLDGEALEEVAKNTINIFFGNYINASQDIPKDTN